MRPTQKQRATKLSFTFVMISVAGAKALSWRSLNAGSYQNKAIGTGIDRKRTFPFGQHKVNKDERGNAPIRYEAVLAGLDKIGVFAAENSATVHMPRIGCGLAGGTWDQIEPLLISAIADRDILITVYDF
jgi:hypothetical protein